MIDPASLLAFCGTLALNGLLSCAAKVYRAAQYRSAAVLVPAVLGLLWCCNASIPLMAQESQQRPVKNPEREAWRKAMVRTPLPKKGCFQVSYPNKEWKEIACSNAKVVIPNNTRPVCCCEPPSPGVSSKSLPATRKLARNELLGTA